MCFVSPPPPKKKAVTKQFFGLVRVFFNYLLAMFLFLKITSRILIHAVFLTTWYSNNKNNYGILRRSYIVFITQRLSLQLEGSSLHFPLRQGLTVEPWLSSNSQIHLSLLPKCWRDPNFFRGSPLSLQPVSTQIQ